METTMRRLSDHRPDHSPDHRFDSIADVARFLQRPVDGHKGTFGTVVVLGGCASGPRFMLGGPAFSALAALRSGAGLAVLAVPRPLMTGALIVAPPATGVPLPVDGDGALQPAGVAEAIDGVLGSGSRTVLAIGPGLGRGTAQQQIVVRLVAQDEVPLVIDADALNALAELPDVARDLRAPAVLTPHPGEYHRLAQAFGLRTDSVGSEHPERRINAAEALSRRLGCVTVLKGHRTVVSDGLRSWTCERGTPALGTAGTGDVLTGIVASFIAQFGAQSSSQPSLQSGGQSGAKRSGVGAAGGVTSISGPIASPLGLFECACLAVELHALSAERWAARHGDAGMLATDLIAELPDGRAAMQRG